MFAVGTDYHAQLEQYAAQSGCLHKARVILPLQSVVELDCLLLGLNEGAAVTNAEWLSENLKQIGYNYFQIDEGYQYARGEYSNTDANLFLAEWGT